MTILPNKRNNSGTDKQCEKGETSSSGASGTVTRHNRALLATSQLLIQDTSSNSQGHSPGSPKCRPFRASKRKTREHLDHQTASKTSVSPGLSYSNQQADETTSDVNVGSGERNNSEDEYEPIETSNEEWEARDHTFYDLMRKKGLVVKRIEEDGACLFRAIADQVYGNEDMHSVIRHNCMDYIIKNRDFFSEYITEDINRYVSRKRNDFVHGNHLEIQALSEMYNRTIEVYCYSEEPINIFHGPYKAGYEPIRLSYQRGTHYNSIRDPYRASIGVGLGLPNHHPGEADRKLLKDASTANELILIEQAMIQDKIAATDWEATNDAILEQAARESWALYVNDNGNLRDPLPGCSSASSRTHRIPTPPRHRTATPPHNNSPRGGVTRTIAHSTPGTSRQADCEPNTSPSEENICIQMPPEMFGINRWDDDADILAKVLAESQMEYLDNLRSSRNSGANSSNSLDQPGPSCSNI